MAAIADDGMTWLSPAGASSISAPERLKLGQTGEPDAHETLTGTEAGRTACRRA
jgi:hypothetical protein